MRNAVFRASQSLGSSKIPGHPRIRVAQSFKSPNASGRLMLRDVQCFGSFKASGHPRLQVTQGFRSPKASDRPKLQVIKGFRSSKTSGLPRLQIAQISGFQASLMKNRKKNRGYRPFSTIEFDADVKKSLFRESRASFLLYSQRNCP